MKVLLLILCATALFGELTFDAETATKAQKYTIKESSKDSSSLDVSLRLKPTLEWNNQKIFAHLYTQKNEDASRTFARLNELFWDINFKNDKLSFGKLIRFFGSLEVYNIANNFNQKDMRDDVFDEERVGSWAISWIHYLENSSFFALIKLYEEANHFPSNSYVYSLTTGTTSINDALQSEKSQSRPSIYLGWSGSSDGDLAYDWAIIIQNGYDSQSYFTYDFLPNQLFEHAYLVNKITTYDTLVYGETLYKLEASLVQVIDNLHISDYWHLGVGFEHTISGFYQEADLGIIAEYYKYKTLQSGKLSANTLGQMFQNDLFLGLRYSFNDIDSSSLLGGVLYDFDENTKGFFVEYESRIFDTFKFKADFRDVYIPNRHQRFSLQLQYYF